MINIRRRGLASTAIVLGTFASVLSNTILNVPIPAIARDLHVSIANATLLISANGIAFATFLPLGAWMGNRFGRRKVYCLAVAALGVAGFVAIFAQNLETLVAMRIVQGAASSAIVPLVMTMLSDFYEPNRQAFALSLWAISNSLGQALGPPLGGVLTSTLTWRSTFAPTPLIVIATCVATLAFVPSEPRRFVTLEWRGALALTVGALLLQVAFTLIPQVGIGSPLVVVCAGLGILCVIAFGYRIRTAKDPFISPRTFKDISYVSSCISVFGAAIALGGTLLAVPLYLIQIRRFATALVGVVAFALPFGMVVFAPLTSRVVKRVGSAGSIRLALAALAIGSAGVAVVIVRDDSVAAFSVFLIVIGVAVALSYTSTAVGTAQTAAGDAASIGLYNLVRIGGSAVGAAMVAIVLNQNAVGFADVFAISTFVVLCAMSTAFFVQRSQNR